MDENAPETRFHLQPSYDDKRHARLSNAERAVLVTAWLVTSVIGATFVYSMRITTGPNDVAAMAAIGFVILMTGAYFLGARLYSSQNRRTVSDIPLATDLYRRALKPAVIQQLIFVTLTALMLDGGDSFRYCAAITIGYWAMVLIIVSRRPRTPTNGDLWMIRYGYLVLYFVVGMAMAMIIDYLRHQHF